VKRDKTLRVLGMIVAVALSAGACSGAATTAPSTTSPAPATVAPATVAPATGSVAPATSAPATPVAQIPNCVIGHTFPNLQNPFYVSLRDSMSKALTAAGCTYIATDSQESTTKQLTDVENLINRGVKVLIIDNVDATAIVPAFKDAAAANIPVLVLARAPTGADSLTWDAYVTIDNVALSKAGCQYIVDQLKGQGTVVNLQGLMSIAPGQDRSKGCLEALDAAAPGITAVNVAGGNFDIVNSERVMTDYLTAHPTVDAVFGANDAAALGAIKALQEAKLDPTKIPVVGIDGTVDAFNDICTGTMAMDIATPAAVEASLAFPEIQAIMAGQLSNHKLINFPYDIVTKANLAQMADLSAFSGFHCP
jgi:ribose transport system substrate-binding protein